MVRRGGQRFKSVRGLFESARRRACQLAAGFPRSICLAQPLVNLRRTARTSAVSSEKGETLGRRTDERGSGSLAERPAVEQPLERSAEGVEAGRVVVGAA